MLFQKEIAQQKAVNEAILETQETTLNNLAQELHDDAGQQLTYLNFQLENFKLMNNTITEKIIPISESVTNLATTIRDLSHALNNQKIKDLSFIESIQNEFNRLNKLNIINCCLEVSEDFNYTFEENEKIILFRIFQEITNNMLKHSNAKTFTATISNNSIVFKDDGIGFSLENSNLSTSNGIENIKSRADLINFSCKIDSEISKGTTIKIEKL